MNETSGLLGVEAAGMKCMSLPRIAVKVPTELEEGGVTQHFSRVLSMPAKNEVFSLDSDSWSRL